MESSSLLPGRARKKRVQSKANFSGSLFYSSPWVNLSHSPLPPSLLLLNERADTSISVYSGQRRTKERRDMQTRRSDANAPTFDDKEKLATQKSPAAPPLHTGGEKRVFFCFSFPLFGGVIKSVNASPKDSGKTDYLALEAFSRKPPP